MFNYLIDRNVFHWTGLSVLSLCFPMCIQLLENALHFV